MRPCVVCNQPGASEVWGYPVCRTHEADWRTNVEPPPEHAKAGEVPHEDLCAAWAAATRAFLVRRYREAKTALAAVPGGAA